MSTTINRKCIRDSMAVQTSGVSYGSGQDSHCVAGRDGVNTVWSLLAFEDIFGPGGIPANTQPEQLVWARLYMTRTTNADLSSKPGPTWWHDGPTTGAAIRVRRITANWPEGTHGADHKYHTANAVNWNNKPGDTAAGEVVSGSQPSGGDEQWWVDISDIVKAWISGQAQHGIYVRSHNDIADINFFSRHVANEGRRPFLRLNVLTNQKPNNPTIVAPTGRISGATPPTYVGTYSDPDHDPIDAAQVRVATSASTDGNGMLNSGVVWDSGLVSPDWSPSGWQLAHGGSALSRGVDYWVQARVRDSGNPKMTSDWGPPQAFRVNQLPSVSKVSPLANNFAFIHNLAEPEEWTDAGAHAKPRLAWLFSDPDGGPQSAFRLRGYDAASGGNQVFDSFEVASHQAFHNADWALLRGEARWWTIEVWDDRDESSGESSRTAFKVQWGQAIYEHDAGSASAQWAFTATAAASGTQRSLLFATATGAGGAGRGDWVTQIGHLSPAQYLNVLVRLATNSSGAQPTLPQMRFDYLGSGVFPDKWEVASGPVEDWSLSSDQRRFGSQSLRCLHSGGELVRILQVTEAISVLPHTDYTLSAFVKTSALLSEPVRLRVGAPGVAASIAFGTLENGGATIDSRDHPDGWQRIFLRFNSEDRTQVLAEVRFAGQEGEAFWLDGFQLEEGNIATVWKPGSIGRQATIDTAGIAIDKTLGGIMRLRSGDGSLVQLGPKGLTFGTDVPVYSPQMGLLTVEAATRMKELQLRPEQWWERGHSIRVDGDTHDRFVVWGSGEMHWGGGSAVPDVALSRLDANWLSLATGDLFDVDRLRVRGRLRLTNQEHLELSANVNNHPLADGTSILRLGSAGAFDLTGMSGGEDGRVLIVYSWNNNPANAITLKHNSGSSSEGNRFFTPDETDFVLGPREGTIFFYRDNAWYVIDRTKGGPQPRIETKRQSISVGASTGADVTVTWDSAFPNANYTVSAIYEENGLDGTNHISYRIKNRSASSVVVRIVNGTNATRNGTLHVTAVHDG